MTNKYQRRPPLRTGPIPPPDVITKNLLPSTVTVVKQVEKRGKKGGSKTVTASMETNSHKVLMAHVAAMRVWVYEQTLAWEDIGWRMLPMANYLPFMERWNKLQSEFETHLRAFLADYPQLKNDSRRILNGMFREDDYPDDIARRFSCRLDVKPIDESDFRVALSAEEIKSLTANCEARIKTSIESAQNDAVKRLYDCLAKIHERLTATKVSKRKEDAGEHIAATYRDSLIGNARDLCDVLTRLNVADDARLEQFRRETELLAAVEPETLRNSADLAQETAQRAQSILDAMTQTYGANLFAA